MNIFKIYPTVLIYPLINMKPEILSNILFNYSIENYTPGNVLTFVIHIVDSDSVHITIYSCIMYARKIDSKDVITHKHALNNIIRSKSGGEYVKLRTAKRVFKYDKSIHKDRRVARNWNKDKTDPKTPIATIYYVYESNLIDFNAAQDLIELNEQEEGTVCEEGDLIDLYSGEEN